MTRADLLCDIIKYGLNGDSVGARRAAEAICSEERMKRHGVLANRIEDMLRVSQGTGFFNLRPVTAESRDGDARHVFERFPVRKMGELILPGPVAESCRELIGEHMRSDLLRSYGVEPRNRILLTGPPGNGKTTIAEAMADALMLPLMTVRYEKIVGSNLGETASGLDKLFGYVRARRCVLFFDEFETLAKERGDIHDTGEVKRSVGSLLLQIEALPSYVVVIAATNHERLLDKAAWHRFQLRLALPYPGPEDLASWFQAFERHRKFSFGVEPEILGSRLNGSSFAEAEEFAMTVFRQHVMELPSPDTKGITLKQLDLHSSKVKDKSSLEVIG